MYSDAGLDLAVPPLLKTAHVQMSGGSSLASAATFVNIENHVRVGVVEVSTLHATSAGKVSWEAALSCPVIACVANRFV